MQARNSVHPIIQITWFLTEYVLSTKQMKESEDMLAGGGVGGGVGVGGRGWGMYLLQPFPPLINP